MTETPPFRRSIMVWVPNPIHRENGGGARRDGNRDNPGTRFFLFGKGEMNSFSDPFFFQLNNDCWRKQIHGCFLF